MSLHIQDAVNTIPTNYKSYPWFFIKRKYFTINQCKTILRITNNHGRFYGNSSTHLDKKVLYKYIDHPELEWVYEKLKKVFSTNNVWKFKLTGVVDYARLYKFDVGSYIGMHSDVDFDTQDFSKITAVIPLVKRRNWTGGHLHIGSNLVTPKMDIGDCVMFPSFAIHEVTPIESGCRIILAAWVYGPPLE